MVESSLKAAKIFEYMATYIAENGDKLVPKVKFVYHFTVLPKKGATEGTTWTIDLKNGNGKVVKGAEGKADA